MLNFQVTSVDQGLYRVLNGLREHGSVAQSRNGPVLRYTTPISVEYVPGSNYVSHSRWRKANHVFHLFESLWMLCGDADVRPLASILPRMGDYSDNGIHFNGAYGFRWHHANQLNDMVQMLATDRNSRRAVLQLYQPGDLRYGAAGGKDVPCNLSVLFSIDGAYLNMTVYNRSNDIVWGMFGANAVHFHMLHLYVTWALNSSFYARFRDAGVTLVPGTYHQISNDAHVYADILHKFNSRLGICDVPGYAENLSAAVLELGREPAPDRVKPEMDVTTPHAFQDLILDYAAIRESVSKRHGIPYSTVSKFCGNLVVPAYNAWLYKRHDELPQDVEEALKGIHDDNWRSAISKQLGVSQ